MARLLVEAVSAESASGGVQGELYFFVSVSRADDGTPVTGLTKSNFRICSPLGSIIDIDWESWSFNEAEWETADVQPTGCYQLSATKVGPSNWSGGEFYAFGIQVRVFGTVSIVSGSPTDIGQTVVRVRSHT